MVQLLELVRMVVYWQHKITERVSGKTQVCSLDFYNSDILTNFLIDPIDAHAKIQIHVQLQLLLIKFS